MSLDHPVSFCQPVPLTLRTIPTFWINCNGQVLAVHPRKNTFYAVYFHNCLSVRWCGFFFFLVCLVVLLFLFIFSPQSFQRASLPKFLIRGHLNSTNCIITQPLTGELVVETAEAAVKSIELQLVRVETCGKCLRKGNAYRLQ